MLERKDLLIVGILVFLLLAIGIYFLVFGRENIENVGSLFSTTTPLGSVRGDSTQSSTTSSSSTSTNSTPPVNNGTSTVSDGATTGTSSRAVLTAKINQRVNALDVIIVPLEVGEDSRCPADVQCIWAGQVRVRALLSSGLGSGEEVFTLFKPITTEAETVTLVSVEPEARNNVRLLPGDYTFKFEVKKRQ